ncbi:hypothetical protein [Bacillus timonensis]|uniref:hypothetical protein n=1 Tax=Bacillus timonensis TaxID=1033734 RepID=UPI0002896506|nr:hypothetical protein [Bacillus timonensis]
MKKVIVFDAFSFVGYELCCRMLDEEIHVTGVAPQPNEDSTEEDKLLRIGRNAFFHFIEFHNGILNPNILKQSDAVIYPWLSSPLLNRNEEKENLLQSVIDYCIDTKTKLVLVSVHMTNNDPKNEMEYELDEKWYAKINIENSLSEHRKVLTKNVEFLFTFIDFSNKELEEGIQIKNDHKEWILQNIST